MYFVYILKSKKTGGLYVGLTSDVKKRLSEHNEGLSGYTKAYMPWELIYYEAFNGYALARKREKSLKYFGKAYGQLKNRIGLGN
jgi:putative endonuclease